MNILIEKLERDFKAKENERRERIATAIMQGLVSNSNVPATLSVAATSIALTKELIRLLKETEQT